MTDMSGYNPNEKKLYMYLLKLEELPGFDFVDEHGGTLYLDYSKVDWKKLSNDISQLPRPKGRSL